MSEPYLGEIRMFGGNFAIRGWAKCDGQLLPIAQNQALFSLLGTTYGGDGRVTFGLPELRGRVPMHTGNGPGLTPRPLGQKSGQEHVTLNNLQIPSHNHPLTGGVKVKVADQKADTHLASNSPLAKNALDVDNNNQTIEMYRGTGATFNNGNELAGVESTLQVGLDGGNQSHNNLQPYQVVTFLIALTGLFPSRN